jgi:hypothetical protein
MLESFPQGKIQSVNTEMIPIAHINVGWSQPALPPYAPLRLDMILHTMVRRYGDVCYFATRSRLVPQCEGSARDLLLDAWAQRLAIMCPVSRA